jgi:hypothetical protein
MGKETIDTSRLIYDPLKVNWVSVQGHDQMHRPLAVRQSLGGSLMMWYVVAVICASQPTVFRCSNTVHISEPL